MTPKHIPGSPQPLPHPDKAPEAFANPAAEMSRGGGGAAREAWKWERRPETGPARLR